MSNSEFTIVVEDRSRGAGVNLVSKRGTTQTRVKVPKYWLSVKGEEGPYPQTVGR